MHAAHSGESRLLAADSMMKKIPDECGAAVPGLIRRQAQASADAL